MDILEPNLLADTSGSVTVETKQDAEALLWAYFSGYLETPTMGPTTRTGLVVKGEILQQRQSLAISGTVIVYAGKRWKDSLGWTRST